MYLRLVITYVLQMDTEYRGHTNIGSLCRTCMSMNVEMYDIYTKIDDNSDSFIYMLTKCTSIKFEDDDELPRQICKGCADILVQAFKYFRHAEESDTKLRQILEEKPKSQIEVKIEPYEVKNENVDNAPHEDDTHFADNGNESDAESESNKRLIELSTKKEKGRSFICHQCGKSYHKASRYEGHMKTHRRVVNVHHQCNTCGKVFDKASKLSRHADTHNPLIKPFQCTVCPERFKSETLLIAHLVKHTGPKEEVVDEDDNMSGENGKAKSLYFCDICNVSYQSSQSMAAHMRIHNVKGRVLICAICGKTFKKISHLKRHEVSHEDNRPFKCQLCPKSFVDEVQLNEHTNKHKGLTPHTCPVCGKSFAQSSTLTTHIRLHTNKKSYLCPTCGKRFDSSTNLNQHIRRHNGEKTFACNQCPGRYVSKGELQSHMSTHTGARPFVCNTCGNSFTKPNSLAKHKLIHLGVKPHECDVCPMRFNSRDHLKRHYRIHTGEKPYKCDLCERAFTQSNDLVKHKRSHLGDKMYRCTQCTESFRLKTELRRHITTHFTNNQETSSNTAISQPNQLSAICEDAKEFTSKISQHNGASLNIMVDDPMTNSGNQMQEKLLTDPVYGVPSVTTIKLVPTLRHSNDVLLNNVDSIISLKREVPS